MKIKKDKSFSFTLLILIYLQQQSLVKLLLHLLGQLERHRETSSYLHRVIPLIQRDLPSFSNSNVDVYVVKRCALLIFLSVQERRGVKQSLFHFLKYLFIYYLIAFSSWDTFFQFFLIFFFYFCDIHSFNLFFVAFY